MSASMPETMVTPSDQGSAGRSCSRTMARPEGVGHPLTAYRMPIEGRDEWIAAARRLA
jgi:hypothetical protein